MIKDKKNILKSLGIWRSINFNDIQNYTPRWLYCSARGRAANKAEKWGGSLDENDPLLIPYWREKSGAKWMRITWYSIPVAKKSKLEYKNTWYYIQTGCSTKWHQMYNSERARLLLDNPGPWGSLHEKEENKSTWRSDEEHATLQELSWTSRKRVYGRFSSAVGDQA